MSQYHPSEDSIASIVHKVLDSHPIKSQIEDLWYESQSRLNDDFMRGGSAIYEIEDFKRAQIKESKLKSTPQKSWPKGKPIIIGVSGKMGSGKDYVARKFLFDKISKRQSSLITAFADHFKIDISTKESTFEKVWSSMRDQETRDLLQRRGKEEGRDKYGSDIWIRIKANWIKIHYIRGIEVYIIPDVRFKNEIEWIKEQGGVIIRLHAPERTKKRMMEEAKGDLETMRRSASHQSETDLDDAVDMFDYIVNNDLGQEDACREDMEKIAEELFKGL